MNFSTRLNCKTARDAYWKRSCLNLLNLLVCSQEKQLAPIALPGSWLC